MGRRQLRGRVAVKRRRGAYGGSLGASGGLGRQKHPVEGGAIFSAVRPSLPPLLICGLGAWLSCGLSFAGGRVLPISAWDALMGVFALFSLGIALCMVRRSASVLLCGLLGVSLGVLCGAAGSGHLLRDLAWVEGGSADHDRVSFRFEQDASAVTSGFSDGFAGLGRVVLEGGGGPRVRVVVEGAPEAPRYGDCVSGNVRWSVPDQDGEYAQSLWTQGAVAVAYVTVDGGGREQEDLESGSTFPEGFSPAATLVGLRNAAIDGIERQARQTGLASAWGALGDGGASESGAETDRDLDSSVGVLQALTCGYRANLRNTQAYGDFQASGLAHLVAVSGAHLAIVSALLRGLLAALGLGQRASLWVLAVFMGAYVVFAGAPISAFRAAIMAVLGLLSFVPRRQASSLSALGACIMVSVALDASTSTSLSFLLSAGSTLGIALFAQLFASWLRSWLPRLQGVVVDGLAVSLAAGMLSQAVSAAQFSQLSLISPFANVVAAPLLSAVCCGGLVGSLVSLALPWTASVTLGLPLLGAKAMTRLVAALADLPLACIPVELNCGIAVAASALAAAVLWAWWPRVRAGTAVCAMTAAALAAMAAVFVLPLLAGTQVVALNVGQGDALLLRSGGLALLVDTGNRSDLLRSALARNGVWRLDAVVITHPDSDHCGSLEDLSRVVSIDRVLVAAGVRECDCGKCTSLMAAAESVAREGVTALSRKDVLCMGALQLEVVWPDAFQDQGGNADSLCLLARADCDDDGTIDCTALLTGDAESEQLDQMLASGRVGAVDLFKVGHHGSKASVTAEQLRVLRPKACLVSVGEGNRYGHPSSQVMEALQDVGAQVLRTDLQGDLTCTLSPDGLYLRPQYSDAP